MKRLSLFALLTVLCVPAAAQQASPKRSIEFELLELEQDADKAILREALMLQGHHELETTLGKKPDRAPASDTSKGLSEFIAKRKEAIIARAAEMTKSRTAQYTKAPASPPPSTKVDRAAAIEKIEEMQVEIEILQTQVNLLQPSLHKAAHELALAELAEGNDESTKKLDATRKKLETAKTQYVDRSKRLQLKQEELQSMQAIHGFNSMGGGFR